MRPAETFRRKRRTPISPSHHTAAPATSHAVTRGARAAALAIVSGAIFAPGQPEGGMVYAGACRYCTRVWAAAESPRSSKPEMVLTRNPSLPLTNRNASAK